MDFEICLGYYIVSKTFLVYNNQSLKVEEMTHVMFDESSFKKVHEYVEANKESDN